MREHLEPYRKELESTPADIVSQAALVWKCLYKVLFDYVDRNSNWIVRTHEQLSYKPNQELKKLYEMLGLKWTVATELQVKEHTKQGNPAAAAEGVVHQMKRNSVANTTLWKQVLTETEVARVYENVHHVSARYYSDEDW